MATNAMARTAELIGQRENDILEGWVKGQLAATTMRRDLISEDQLHTQSRTFLKSFRDALSSGANGDTQSSKWAQTRSILSETAKQRARMGFSPSETARFIFSLKDPLFTAMRSGFGNNADMLAEAMLAVTTVLDDLGLYTVELHLAAREEVISRQKEEMLELSTPVIQLWDGVLALPLIGTLDSSRTQTVMETLLDRIVSTGSELAILDITGVPVVDTLTAQHILKTVTATRLMGAECIISGVRPQIAQTIVHLGVDLGDVITKATLASALRYAFARRNLTVKRVSKEQS